jgi:hypothetical protein
MVCEMLLSVHSLVVFCLLAAGSCCCCATADSCTPGSSSSWSGQPLVEGTGLGGGSEPSWPPSDSADSSHSTAIGQASFLIHAGSCDSLTYVIISPFFSLNTVRMYIGTCNIGFERSWCLFWCLPLAVLIDGNTKLNLYLFLFSKKDSVPYLRYLCKSG